MNNNNSYCSDMLTASWYDLTLNASLRENVSQPLLVQCTQWDHMLGSVHSILQVWSLAFCFFFYFKKGLYMYMWSCAYNTSDLIHSLPPYTHRTLWPLLQVETWETILQEQNHSQIPQSQVDGAFWPEAIRWLHHHAHWGVGQRLPTFRRLHWEVI